MILLCEKVATLPKALIPSIKRECSSCQAPVWVDIRMEEVATNAQILCMECGKSVVDQKLADGQRMALVLPTGLAADRAKGQN